MHDQEQHHCSCRALAYEAVGLFLVALAADSSKQTHQIQLLLQSLKRSISQPFQQLPGVIATFAAEAVFVLMSPGSAMYPAANKLLLKRPELNIQVDLLRLPCSFVCVSYEARMSRVDASLCASPQGLQVQFPGTYRYKFNLAKHTMSCRITYYGDLQCMSY